MKKFFKIKFYLATLLTCFLISCSSDLDFDQVDNLKLEPVFVANFANFEIPVSAFFQNGLQQNIIYGPIGFDAFSNTFYRDNLKKAVFSFEITSTLPRATAISVELLDRNNKNLMSIPINIPGFSTTPVLVSESVTFENSNIQVLLNTKKLQFVMAMESGSANVNTNSSNLKFRSSVTAYLDVK